MIATREVDDVFMAQLVHRGFSSFVDLDQPANDVVKQLCHIVSQGNVQPFGNDAIGGHPWATVPLSPLLVDWSTIPADDVDQQILKLVALGMQDADIAGVVHASTQTVKNRLSAMLDRSGFHNRTQLAWMATNQAVSEAVLRGLRNSLLPDAASPLTPVVRRGLVPTANRSSP